MKYVKLLVLLVALSTSLIFAACTIKKEKGNQVSKKPEVKTEDTKEESSKKQEEVKDKPVTEEPDEKREETTIKPTSTPAVAEPRPSHVHTWTEVKKEVTIPETGHYETIYEWKDYCAQCMTPFDGLSEKERRLHYEKSGCEDVYTSRREEVGQKWIVETPATTEKRVIGYKCSCGETREKTQYAGMYTTYDQSSWDRLDACKKFMQNGLAGADCNISKNSIAYGNWESVVVCNGSSNGAWMWVFIRDWKLKSYEYLKDAVKEGIIDDEEAHLVEQLYEEIPSIFRGCIESIAPEGGKELYNYIEQLIVRADGNPDNVPYLEGAKGILAENIPGLYVTIEETRGGFSVMFWAE